MVDVAFGKAPGNFHLVALGDVLAPAWCGSFTLDASHVFDTALEAGEISWSSFLVCNRELEMNKLI